MKLRPVFFAVFVSLPLACSAQNSGTTPPPLASPSAAPATSPVPEAERAAPATSAPVSSGPKITYNQCNVDGPYIAMTFDDGPHAEHTPRLLDMLKQRKLKATFFVVGQCAEEYPAIMKRIVDEGHEVASHSWSHPNLGKMGEGGVTDQLQRTHDIIEKTTGVSAKVMRPPYGSFTANQKAWVHKKWGYKVIMWDVDPLDWKIRNASRVHSAIVQRAVPGSIILAHDIHKTTVDAMPQTFDDLTAKGMKFVTVSELLAMDRPVVAKPKATPSPKAVEATGADALSPSTTSETSPATTTPPPPKATAPALRP